MKGVNFCLKISNIPYNSIFTPDFNDFSILITIISGAQQFAVRHVAPLRHIILIYSLPVFALSP
jgi:hypothetical protein